MRSMRIVRRMRFVLSVQDPRARKAHEERVLFAITYVFLPKCRFLSGSVGELFDVLASGFNFNFGGSSSKSSRCHANRNQELIWFHAGASSFSRNTRTNKGL